MAKAMRLEKEKRMPRMGIFSRTAAQKPSNRSQFSLSTMNVARSISLIFFVRKYGSRSRSDSVTETRNEPTIVFRNGTKFSGSSITLRISNLKIGPVIVRYHFHLEILRLALSMGGFCHSST